jgi:hypothetical protein
MKWRGHQTQTRFSEGVFPTREHMEELDASEPHPRGLAILMGSVGASMPQCGCGSSGSFTG